MSDEFTSDGQDDAGGATDEAPTQPIQPPLPLPDGVSADPAAGQLAPLPLSLARYADFSAGAQRQRQSGMRASRLLWITLGAALLLAVVCAGVSLASFNAILGGPGIPGGGNGANGGGAGNHNTTAIAMTHTTTPTSDIVTTTVLPTTLGASPTVTFPPSPTATATRAPTQPPTATPTPVPQPKLSVYPLFLSGSCFNADFHVRVSNAGGGTLRWTAPSKVDGIKVYPASGYIIAGSYETVKLSGTTFLATVSIPFSSNGGGATVKITCR